MLKVKKHKLYARQTFIKIMPLLTVLKPDKGDFEAKKHLKRSLSNDKKVQFTKKIKVINIHAPKKHCVNVYKVKFIRITWKNWKIHNY